MVRQSLLVPFSASQMYQLVNDIESYPSFLSWCKSAIINFRTQDQVQATLGISKGIFNYSFTTLNKLEENKLIKISYIDGPFKILEGYWQFEQIDLNQCEIIFEINYVLSNRLLSLAVESLVKPFSYLLMNDFYQQAKKLYDKS